MNDIQMLKRKLEIDRLNKFTFGHESGSIHALAGKTSEVLENR